MQLGSVALTELTIEVLVTNQRSISKLYQQQRRDQSTDATNYGFT